MDVNCDKCGYGWDSKSKLASVCCPSCGKKIKLRDRVEEDLHE